jgi:hypothetical protein
MPTYPVSRQPSLAVFRRSLLFDRAPTRGRFVASTGTAMRRAVIHVLARLTIAATCTSSAAAFDAMHFSRMTVATVAGAHSLGRGGVSLARPGSISQRDVEFHGEPEDIGKQ